ncbi:MAG: DMT family transporter [Firmicutes bacterium]|nr:DMT family transporter [Bacillota bacterium]
MVKGIIYSVLAGVLICIQGIFNTRASEKMGLWTTNFLVHGSGMLAVFIILLLLGNNGLTSFTKVNKLYLLGGIIGVVIVFSVMKGITLLGASYSITIVLIVQIIISAFISNYGLFNEAVISLDITKIIGLGFMMLGIVLFQLR